MGTEAVGGDVRQATEVVVVEAMQVGSNEAARAEVADAVNAMGWEQQRQQLWRWCKHWLTRRGSRRRERWE